MPQSSPPPEMPERLLTHPEMVAACHARDFAVIFKIAKRAGLYPSLVARLCDMTPSRVGEIISGKRQLRDMTVIERVADGLRIPGHMLGLARRPWETPEALAEPPAALPGEARLWEHHTGSPRTIPGADLDSILATVSGTTLGESTLRALHASIKDYWRRDDEHGGEVLRPAIVGQLRYVVDLIKETEAEDLRHGLHSIAAELARLTGWTYFDARQYSQARTYFAEALRLAKAIDDRQFIANVLACMSLQATYEDRSGDAVALATAAQDCARTGGSTPRVMSMLSMREAFAHASLGDRPATHAAIGEAHRQFERISSDDADPPWVNYFDAPKLTVDTGIAHSRLGEAGPAEPMIANVLRQEYASNQRGRAFHTFWLATTQLQQGHVDQACHTATTALETASAIDSRRVTGHLREFHQQLGRYGRAPAAVAFEARLRAALR